MKQLVRSGRRQGRQYAVVVAVNCGLTLLLAATVLLLAELYLRNVVPRSSEDSIFEYTLETPRYKVMRRNTRIVAYGKEFRTNSLGFRDSRDDIPAKKLGEYRIIVLGDSFTVSAGVEYARIFTSLIEQRLQQRFPGVHVINLAVGGYNVIQYAVVLEEIGLGLKPDLIVVAVYPDNDFSNVTYEENARVARGDGTGEGRWYEQWLVYKGVLSRVEARIRTWWETPSEDATRKAERERLENLKALQRIVVTGRSRGVPVVVAALPYPGGFDAQAEKFRLLERYCGELEVPYLSLLGSIVNSGVHRRALRLNLVDDHPNERYHAIVADALGVFLEPVVRTGARRLEMSPTVSGPMPRKRLGHRS